MSRFQLNSAFFVIPLWIALGSIAFGERPETFRSSQVDRDKGIHWEIPIAQQHHFSEFARVGFRHELVSTSSKMTMPVGSRYIDVRVVVTGEDGKRREKVVHCAVTEPNQGLRLRWVLSFYVDVSEQFDALPMGKLTVEFSFPGESIEVDGKPYSQDQITGPTAEVFLERFDAKKVPATPEADVHLIIRRFEGHKQKVRGEIKNEFYPVVDLVNDSDDYLLVEGYGNESRPTEIARPFNTETLRPLIGWQPGPGIGICGTGWGRFTIPPRTTERIHAFAVGGHGVCRLSIPFKRRADEGSTNGTALSQPFVQTEEGAKILDLRQCNR